MLFVQSLCTSMCILICICKNAVLEVLIYEVVSVIMWSHTYLQTFVLTERSACDCEGFINFCVWSVCRRTYNDIDHGFAADKSTVKKKRPRGIYPRGFLLFAFRQCWNPVLAGFYSFFFRHAVIVC